MSIDITCIAKGIVDSMIETVSIQGIDPFIVVYEDYPGVVVPKGFSHDGCITLNLALHAVRGYNADDDCITYNTQFNGIAYNVVIPYGSVMGIYPRSHSQMMIHLPVLLPKEPEVESSIELPKPNPMASADWAKSAVVHSR